MFPRLSLLFTGLLLTILLPALLSACQGDTSPPEAPRLVRTVVVGSQTQTLSNAYAGDVRARVETRLSFRVGGKLVARLVDVGTSIQPGMVLARLDPGDLRLAQDTLAAQLRASQTDLAQVSADDQRAAQLLQQHFISQAEYDSRHASLLAAQARVSAAQAQFEASGHQTGYATLLADRSGVVTEVDAESGQVVAAGQTVYRIAEPQQRELAISIPESRLNDIQSARALTLVFWALPGKLYHGRVREIAPQADSGTRTFAVRVSIVDADAAIRLGMSGEVRLDQGPQTLLRLPLSALYEQGGQHHVWLVENGHVHLQTVTVGNLADNEAVIASGIHSGQRVVIAGANELYANEAVRLLPAEPAP